MFFKENIHTYSFALQPFFSKLGSLLDSNTNWLVWFFKIMKFTSISPKYSAASFAFLCTVESVDFFFSITQFSWGCRQVHLSPTGFCRLGTGGSTGLLIWKKQDRLFLICFTLSLSFCINLEAAHLEMPVRHWSFCRLQCAKRVRFGETWCKNIAFLEIK